MREKLEQKKALHKKSLDKAQYWGNTIMGKRKARLAAQDQKGEALEVVFKKTYNF